MPEDNIASLELGRVVSEKSPREQEDQICEENVSKDIANQSKTGRQMDSHQSKIDDKHGKITSSEVQTSGHVAQEPIERQQAALDSEQEYSIFSKNEKRFIVITATLAAALSPISTNIFFPALNILASDLHVSNSLINLTVTSYMVGTGIVDS